MTRPIPIPDLEGESARQFEEAIKKGPTELQIKMMEEGKTAYKTIKYRT